MAVAMLLCTACSNADFGSTQNPASAAPENTVSESDEVDTGNSTPESDAGSADGISSAPAGESVDSGRDPVKDKISDPIPGIGHQGDYGLIRAGAVLEMIEDIKKTGFTIEDIQTVYSGIEMCQRLWIIGYSVEGSVSSPPRSLRAVDSLFPVEYINRIDEETVYTVYKITDVNDEPVFMYLFYKKTDVSEKFDDGAVEKWWIEEPVFYMKKSLEYKDFSNIQIGSAASEVKAVDPIVGGHGTRSYHLLRDGILRIEYAIDEKDGVNRVTALKFDESFEMPLTLENENSPFISVKIDPKDYPV